LIVAKEDINMKNKFVFAASFSLVFMSLLSCGGKKEDAKSGASTAPLQLTGWSYEVDTVNDNLKVFTEQTGISVDPFYNFPSEQFHDKLVTSFIAGTTYDVIYVRDSYLAEWASAGWLMPVDGFEGLEDIKKGLSQGAINSMTYDGKLYGLPYYAGRRVMAYNKEHLNKAGIAEPPKTWEELISQARTIKARGIAEYPIILDLNKSEHIMETMEVLVYAFGGRFFNDANEPVFDKADPTVKNALEFVKQYYGDLIDPAALVSTDHDVVRTLSAGTRTFSFCSDYNLKTMNDPVSSAVPGQLAMALIPGNEKVRSGSIGSIRLYSIAANVKNKDRAWELVKFLGYQDKNGEYFVPKKWALQFGLGFVQTDLFDDTEIQADINTWGSTDVIKEQDDYVIPRFYRFTPWFQEWQTGAWEDMQRAIMGEITSDQALEKMAKSARDLAASYK
jgi:multiple sugar transport system substrate-binding protein